MIFSNASRRFITTIWTQYAIVLFPLIACLPLTTNSYEAIDNNWCSYSRSGNGLIWFGTILVIELIIMMYSIGVMSIIVLKLYRSGEYSYGTIRKVLSTSGLYSLATIGCFLPKVFSLSIHHFARGPSGSDNTEFVAHLVSYIAGILYAIIFYFERESLAVFEAYVMEVGTDVNVSENESPSISEFSDTTDKRSSINSINRLSLLLNKSRMLSTASIQSPVCRTVSGGTTGDASNSSLSGHKSGHSIISSIMRIKKSTSLASSDNQSLGTDLRPDITHGNNEIIDIGVSGSDVLSQL